MCGKAKEKLAVFWAKYALSSVVCVQIAEIFPVLSPKLITSLLIWQVHYCNVGSCYLIGTSSSDVEVQSVVQSRRWWMGITTTVFMKMGHHTHPPPVT